MTNEKQNDLLCMKNIHKAFNNVPVLKGIDFEVHAGEIVTIIGSNGAGKSTLMNIVAGVHKMDEGEIFFEGKQVNIKDPNVAERLAIGMVHQEPSLCENMKVYENIFLNREPKKSNGLLDRKKMIRESQEIMQQLGFDVDVTKTVQDLSIVSKVVVSIAKVMIMKKKLLILDEVTAALNQREVEHLFEIIAELKKSKIGIIFISHKIREIVQISDRVYVLRDGKVAGIFDKQQSELKEKDIINLMLGETQWKGEYSERTLAEHSENVLLDMNHISKHNMFSDISIKLYENEIIGLAGLKGSGITELMYSIFGIMQYDSGTLCMEGQPLKAKCPEEAIKRGICMITNDRQNEGLAMNRSIQENILIASLNKVKNSSGFLNKRRMKDVAKEYIGKLSVKTSGPMQQVKFLSGGNQQKVVVAKWLFRDSKIVLIDEPTRGIDIKAKNEIYDLLLEEKNQGKGLMIYSPETRELLNICSRIIVISNGKQIAEVKRGDELFTEKGLLHIMHSY